MDPVQIPGDQDTHASTTLPPYTNNLLGNDKCLELLVAKERADRTANTILIAPKGAYSFSFYITATVLTCV